jgi:hypothetical protein
VRRTGGALTCLVLLAAGLLVAVAVQPSAAQRGASAASCTADQKAKRISALHAFQKQMLARRRAYFQAHSSTALRRAFVQRQLAQLKRLQATAACIVKPDAPEVTETIPTPTTTAPPAPPPTGHYAGVTAQGADMTLDVANAQWGSGVALGVIRITVARIDETCTPERSNVAGPIQVQQGTGGTFLLSPISLVGFFQVPSNPSGLDTFRFTGYVVGRNAEGTFTWKTTFTDQGTSYTCTSGTVTWTAAYTG